MNSDLKNSLSKKLLWVKFDVKVISKRVLDSIVDSELENRFKYVIKSNKTILKVKLIIFIKTMMSLSCKISKNNS
jgi:hypothetical protein